MYNVTLNLGFFGHAMFANQYYKRLLVERPLPLHQISNMCLVDIILFFISIKMFLVKFLIYLYVITTLTIT